MKLVTLILTVLLCNVCSAQIPCNNWLYNPSVSSTVNIGDLDVSGNQITVEAIINRTTPYLPGGLDDSEGDVVSKHNTPADVNYLLRPNHAYITTPDGFFSTPDICDLELNKTYHIAMVYDGSTLKFYRDGFLMSQVNATGNLFLNDWNTQIGHYDPSFWKTQFIGYTNEVRIWNVARTQAQIKTYMNTSLPTPATQTGLLAYYTFDNLLNKQGNTVYNGTLTGSASINSTNTACNFTADSCMVPPLSCNNWLSNPSSPSYAEVGDINIQGNKITVEAVFNRTTPYSGGLLYAGDLVSKHNTPADANYLLRPNNAEITTSNGYFRTPDICEIELNKTYHVAMVYDGVTLKFYRNGFLMSQVAATGNLFQNSWKTRIGFYEPQAVNTNFIGFINEVRIWNVDKSQADIKSYMNTSLPNPTSQTGLVAYYAFDNLLNKQGNTAYNGVLGGSASINATNTNCNLIVDSCAVVTSITGISKIINDYTPVIAFNPCTNTLTVEDATKYKAGDTVLIMQMKGAVIDSSNTASFGTVTDYKNAGNYEFNYVKSKAGSIIELKNILTRQYDIPDGKVQLIRVPYFKSAVISDTLTCLPWDGKKGGVLVLNVKDTLTFNADINVNGKGFEGGDAVHSNPSVYNCDENQFYYSPNTDFAAGKGEGIAILSSVKSNGKGKYANGGGGGNSHNSGGGGGSNGSSGGVGGYQFEGACSLPPFDNRGIGGTGLAYSNAANRIFLGGGGGAGHANNPELFFPSGGNGGGICIVMAGLLQGNNKNIIANGDDGLACSGFGATGCHEGMGGGGGAGAILLNINTYSSAIAAKAKGGKGGDMVAAGLLRLGPGGGGSGGICWISNPAQPADLAIDLNSGVNGVCTGYSNDPWGSAAGQNGSALFNLTIPFDNTPFKINIDSVRIKSTLTSCNSFNLNGFAFTNTAAINKWEWLFDDGTKIFTQNTSHSYSVPGNHPVKLTVTDIKGCKDSVTITLTTVALPANPTYIITEPTCSNALGSINITIPLGPNLQYSINGTTYQSSPVFSNLAIGSYNLTVKDNSSGCITLPINLNINAATIPVSVKSNVTQPSCSNLSGTITVTSPLASELQYSIDNTNYQASTAFNNVMTGSYNLTVKNTTTSCISLPALVVINPSPATPGLPVANATQPICNNDKGSITVIAPAGSNIEYSIDNTNFQSSVNFTNLTPASYNLIAKNTGSGCTSVAANVVISMGTGTPSAPAGQVSKQPDCAVATGTISISSPLGSNYSYSINNSAYQTATNFINLTPGSYNILVKNISNGCISSVTQLTVSPVQASPTAPGTAITQPTCAVITGTINITSPAGNNLQYSINNSAFQTAASFAGLAPGSYSLMTKDILTQCISSATIAVVEVVPSPPSAPVIGNISDPSCSVPKGTVEIALPTGSNFEYSINGTAYQVSNKFINLDPGTYSFSVRNIATSCVSSSTPATVSSGPAAPPVPTARVTVQPTCIISEGTIVISSPAGPNYEYSIDGQLYQSTMIFTGLAPKTYNITVKDLSTGCISQPLGLAVNADISLSGRYLIPTAFTPNHDGINECFGIKYWGVVTAFQLIIYNRWGQPVFSTANPNDCWDGIYKGVAASQGNYVYYIKAKTLCGPVEKRGNVLLIR